MKSVILIIFICLHGISAVKTRFYPKYHLAPPKGWMNDPNGFSVYKNEYHLFYQYNPESSHDAGTAHWAHAKSKDLFSWEHLPIAMYPDKDYDKNGVFSGSVLVEDDVMYAYYTGNVNQENKKPSSIQTQNLAISKDGVKFTKYEKNPIILGEDKQPDFRDPKVWKHDDTYYMVLGNSVDDGNTGRVLLYTSKDKINWKEIAVIDKSNGSMGYMWECPDFFELDGKFILLFSPQGVKQQGYLYKNLYQLGYIVGDFDYKTNQFTKLESFKLIDYGYDIYASQTVLDGSGRRIFIGWNDMWKENYPEQDDGFEGQMTIPRILNLKNNIIVQQPVSEIESLYDEELFSSDTSSTSVTFDDRAAYVYVEAEDEELKLTLQYDDVNSNENKKEFTIHYKDNFVTIDRGDKGDTRQAEWKPNNKLVWKIYIDSSSVELFCGEGEVTFTSRIFFDGTLKINLETQSKAYLRVNKMKRSVPEPDAEDSSNK